MTDQLPCEEVQQHLSVFRVYGLEQQQVTEDHPPLLVVLVLLEIQIRCHRASPEHRDESKAFSHLPSSSDPNATYMRLPRKNLPEARYSEDDHKAFGEWAGGSNNSLLQILHNYRCNDDKT